MPEVGSVLGERYRLEHLIARGGSALVFRGRDLQLDLMVAVKVMRADTGVQGDLRAEALAAMKLSHPFIARTYNWQRFPGCEALIMEYVPGPNLHMVARDRSGQRMGLDEAGGFAVDLMEAIDHAHSTGVIHNDIKPRNLLVAPGDQLKVCDFGIARRQEVSWHREARWIVGTVAFMAPERIRHEDAVPESDIYAAGATLYSLLVGQPPFGISADAAFEGHLNQAVPRSPYVPDPLYAVIARAMAKRPEDRYRTALDMADALRALGFSSRYLAWRSRDDASTSERLRVEPMVVSPAVPEVAPAPRAREAWRGEGAEHRRRGGAAAVRPRVHNDLSDMVSIGPRVVRLGLTSTEVARFLLDRFPVTRADWAEFVAAGHAAPSAWGGAVPPAGTERLPITDITMAAAAQYASWRGRRLPTAVEWMAAALPGRTSAFPWVEPCVFDRCRCPYVGPAELAPVDAHPQGVSLDGVHDLYGNAWEWTAPDLRLPNRAGDVGWVFGASYRGECTAPRGTVPRLEVSAQGAFPNVGFRCAADQREGE